MFHVVIFITAWILWILFADKKRWRELFPVTLFASFLGCLTDNIMHYYTLWHYQNLNSLLISIFNDFGVYIVVTYLFIQWLPKEQTFRLMFGYWFIWTGLSISLELVYHATNHLTYHQWWNSWWSYLADWILYWIFYEYHKIFNLKKLSE